MVIIDALGILCTQLTRDLFAIAKLLFDSVLDIILFCRLTTKCQRKNSLPNNKSVEKNNFAVQLMSNYYCQKLQHVSIRRPFLSPFVCFIRAANPRTGKEFLQHVKPLMQFKGQKVKQ